jgi:DNA-binding MarR family transcriptional regulator
MIARYGRPVTARRPRPAAQPAASGARLSYLVFRLERRIRARLDDTLARHGVTTTEYMALSELRTRDGASSAELARIAFVTPQAMNLVIRDLERRGLIRRDPHPGGGRTLCARLTPEGVAVLRRCDSSLDDIEAVMLEKVDNTTRETLRDGLTVCARALRSDAY